MQRFLVFALVLVAVVGICRSSTSPVCPAPTSGWQQVARFVAGWWLTHRIFREEAPAPAPDLPSQYAPAAPQYLAIEEGQPVLRGEYHPGEEIARKPIMRSTSADGTPQLDHGAGW